MGCFDDRFYFRFQFSYGPSCIAAIGLLLRRTLVRFVRYASAHPVSNRRLPGGKATNAQPSLCDVSFLVSIFTKEPSFLFPLRIFIPFPPEGF